MTRQEYNTYNQQKEQRLLKKKRRKRQLLKLKCYGLLGLIFSLIAVASFLLYQDNGLPTTPSKTRTYAASAHEDLPLPQSFSDADIKRILEEMAESNDDFAFINNHFDSYPVELLNALCNNPEMINYCLGYLSKDSNKAEPFSKAELTSESPLLLQWDTRWGYHNYGNSEIALSGCAPTCLSMVILSLTHNESVTPASVAKYAQEAGYYVEGTGTSWSLMTEGSSHYSVTGKELCLDKSSVINTLSQGHPIICSMAPGNFTTTGHFIVLAGTNDGKIIVHDPNSIARSNVLWDYETLEPQIKNLWYFTNQN